MKLSVKNIGPLKDAELELGDITVLLGSPNSGKSYTLRSLYAKLVMLDKVAQNYIIKNVVKEMELWEHFNYFVNTIISQTIIAVIALYDYITSENSKEILERLRTRIGVEKININIEDNEVIITLRNSENIAISNIANPLNEKLNSVLLDLLPTTEKTEVIIPEVFIPEMSSLLSEMFRTPFEKETSNIDDRMGITSILRASIRLENKKSIKIITDMEIHLVLNGLLWNRIQKDFEKVLKKAKFKGTKGREMDKLFDILFKNKPLGTHLIFLYDWRVRTLLRDISMSQEFVNYFSASIGEKLRRLYEDAFNLQYAIFIPFGRSPFVYQLDTISNVPYLWRDFINIYKNNLPFYFYIYHLSKGRGQLLNDKADERLISLFNPILQGELIFDRAAKRLRYKKWNAVDVPINYASALAGEVSGIMLPILGIPHNSYLIIEEPEAQLHYSAQILMALVLVGLSSEFNHKIIFSTHSDVLAITLAYLKELDYDENTIVKLIQELLKFQGINVDNEKVRPLAKAVSKAKDLDIKFYYYEPKPDGTVKVSKVSTKKVLREVPGITNIMDILASWALSL